MDQIPNSSSPSEKEKKKKETGKEKTERDRRTARQQTTQGKRRKRQGGHGQTIPWQINALPSASHLTRLHAGNEFTKQLRGAERKRERRDGENGERERNESERE